MFWLLIFIAKPIITPTTTNSTHINSVPTKNPVIGSSSSSTAAATAATTTIVPTPTISGSTASGAFGFTSLFYTSIILLLVLVPAVYVYYQNREKVCCMQHNNDKIILCTITASYNMCMDALPDIYGLALGRNYYYYSWLCDKGAILATMATYYCIRIYRMKLWWGQT